MFQGLSERSFLLKLQLRRILHIEECTQQDLLQTLVDLLQRNGIAVTNSDGTITHDFVNYVFVAQHKHNAVLIPNENSGGDSSRRSSNNSKNNDRFQQQTERWHAEQQQCRQPRPADDDKSNNRIIIS